MFTINFDVWSSKPSNIFVIERYYYKGRWTPFCKIRLRYFRTVREMSRSNRLPVEPPIEINKVKDVEQDQ